MSDRPPLVDFSSSPSDLQNLSAERQRIQRIVEDIRGAMMDVSRYGAEGARYAEIAAGWAAVLMVADICKIGLAVGDRRASLLFKQQDRVFVQVNKMLKALGRGQIATKDDVMKTLDPDLRRVNTMIESVQNVRRGLQQVGVKENKEFKLVADLGVAMTHDTLLMMQAMNLQQQTMTNTASAQTKMQHNLTKVSLKLMLVDQELTRAFERAAMRSRTA